MLYSSGKLVATSALLALSAVNALSFSSSVSETVGKLSARAPKKACNGFTEFCDRRYSNITEVCAHNSPFAEPGNIASNQDYGVLTQLNDGIRMLQGQVHEKENELVLCHSECSLFNAGTLESYLSKVVTWLEDNPREVVTILMGNADRVDVENYKKPLKKSGLKPYLYRAPKKSMRRKDWPTLGEMIADYKRVVFMLDYGADEKKVPYILDEFNHMWETPFSPTDTDFPCTVDRPSDLTAKEAKQRMYIANHNLNTEIFGLDILIPARDKIEDTNSASGPSSLGKMARECRKDYNRPPNFLLVDYYHEGGGSVFKVAAKMNGVKYKGKCCGGDE